MEKRSLKKIISITVLLALLIGVIPLLKITSGEADNTSPISARVNGFAQTDGSNLDDVIKKSKLKAPVTSIEVISGVIVESDFQKLDKSALRNITIKTMQDPPQIGDPTLFDGAPSNRSIRVMSSLVEQYKSAPDNDVNDNQWYGFNIIDVDPGLMTAGLNAPVAVDEKEIKTITLSHNAIKVGSIPSNIVEIDSNNSYSTASTIWTTADTKSFSTFEYGKTYKALVELKADDTYKFSSDTELVLVPADNSGTFNSVAERPVVRTVKSTNDTISYEVTFSNGTPASKAGTHTTVNIGLKSPIKDQAVSPATVGKLTAGTTTYTVTSTDWTDNGTPITKFNETGDFVAKIVLTAAAGDDFVGVNTATITDSAANPKYRTKNITATPSTTTNANDTLTVVVTYELIPSTIRDAKINLASPMGGVKILGATPDGAGFTVDETKWFDGTTEITAEKVFDAEPTTKYIAKIKLVADGVTLFSKDAKPTIVDANAGVQFRQKPITDDKISADLKELTFSVEYEKNDKTCTHPGLIISGPKVPIPPDYLTETNVIEARIGGKAEFNIREVKCSSCGVPLTDKCEYKWTKVDRTDPSRPYIPMGDISGLGKNIGVVPSVVLNDINYDYFALVTLPGSLVREQKTDHVIIKVVDSTKPDPYFKPSTVTADIGTDFTLEVKDGRTPPIPQNQRYDWYKGTTATGTPIKTNYDDPTFILRDPDANSAGEYTVVVTNEKNGLSGTATVTVKVAVAPENLIPILATDIFVLDFKAPETGQTPVMLTAPAGANYTITHKWRNSTSIVAPPSKFAAGKTYIADVTITAKNGYRIGEVGATTMDIDVINNYLTKTFKGISADALSCSLDIKFNSTMNPDKQNQSQLEFVTKMPEIKSYGDTDFLVAVQGGSGNGAITFTSSDSKILEVVSTNDDTAVIRVAGGGSAVITAAKAAGTDTSNNYNPVTISSPKITVKPKILVVKAADKTIKAGTTTEVFPVEISGFVKGDNQYNLAGFETPIAKSKVPVITEETTTKKPGKNDPVKTPAQLAAEEKAKLDKLMGTYEIIPSGGVPTPAYSFRYITGQLTVNQSGLNTAIPPNQNYLKADSITIEDRRNGILLTDVSNDGIFKAGTELCVENTTYLVSSTDKALYNANINAAAKGKQLAQLYDISLKVDGSTVDPTGAVLVDITLSENIKGRYSDLQVVYISEYGDVTVVPHRITSQKVSFLTDHFSQYGIIGVLRPGVNTGGTTTGSGTGTNVPQTSDSNKLVWVFVAIAIISSCVVVGVWPTKKSVKKTDDDK